MRLFFVILLISSLLRCTSSKKNKIVHPTEQNLFNKSISNGIDLKDTVYFKKNKSISELQKSLNNLRVKSSIGKLYGKEENMFGQITDILMDSLNHIFILDKNKQNIRVFSEDGKYLQTLGGKGDGPGEFERASSMALYKNFLIVSNGFRLEVFKISKQDIKFQQTHKFKKAFRSICTIDNKLFAHYNLIFDENIIKNLSSVNTIQTISLPSFDTLSALGKPYASDNIAAVERLSVGNISCNKKTATVTFSFEKVPLIYNFSSEDGSLLNGIRLDNINTTKIIASNSKGRPSLTYQPPKEGYWDKLLPPIHIKNEYNLLQIIRLDVSDEEYNSNFKVLSILFNSLNGNGYLIGESIPIINHVSNNRVLTISSKFISSKINIISF